MELNVIDERKLVEVWLTKPEYADAELQRRLQPLYKSYKAKKYLVAVLVSGDKSLEECTSGLLIHNQTVAAQRDLERRKDVRVGGSKK